MDGFRDLRGPARRSARDAPTVALVLAGAGGTALVVALAVAAAHAGVRQDVTLPGWWGPWPTGEDYRPGWGAVALAATGGLCVVWALLARGWLLRGRPAPGPRAITLAALAWAVPLLPTGPIGSLDVQSYVAVGRLADLGLDPYRFGPGWLSSPYAAAVGPLWEWTPTPYGPVQIALLHQVAGVAGEHVGLAVLLVRAVVVLALAAAVGLSLLATPAGERPAVLLLVALNPLVLVHVVSGAHLDVVVGALAVLVVTLVRSGRPAAAMVLAVVALQVKMPGAVLVAYVALDVWRRTARPLRRRRTLEVLGAGALATGATVALLPNAFGWLGALGVPGTVRSGLAPSTWVSYLAAFLTGQTSVRGLDVATTVGRALTVLAGAWLVVRLLRHATDGPERAAYRGVGWGLVVLALAGPVTYPWYLTWGLFAAAVGSGLRGRLGLLALSAGMTLVGGFTQGAAQALVVVAALAAVAATLLPARARVLAPAPA